MPTVYIFDLDTLREAPGARPCYLIGPFDSFDTMTAWIEANDGANDGRLSLHYQPITLPDASGLVPAYTPEQAAQDLPILHQQPEIQAQMQRMAAISAAMERLEAEQEAFVDEHGMPSPSRPN